jgi:uncharacterized membrane-anchored protein
VLAIGAAYRVGGQPAVVLVLLGIGLAWLRSRRRSLDATRFSPAVWLLFAVAAVTFGLIALMATGSGAGVVVFLFCLFLTVTFMAQANRSADGR